MTFGIPVGIAVLAAASIGGVYYMTSRSSAPPKETKEQVYEDNRPRNASVIGSLPVENTDNTTAVTLGGRRKSRKSKSKRRRTKKVRKH